MEKTDKVKDLMKKLQHDYEIYTKSHNPLYKQKVSEYLKKHFAEFVDVYVMWPFYIIDRTIDNIKFQTDYIPKSIKKVKMPPELTIDCLSPNIKEQTNTALQVEIDRFIDILATHFSPNDLKFFHRNISSLVFNFLKREQNSEKNTTTIGLYSPRYNKISLLQNTSRNTAMHELFHMASSYYDNNKRNINQQSFSGFFQWNKDGLDIGYGLNEGYTQLLTNRYSTEHYNDSYKFETLVAEGVEEIIGQEKMQSLYLQANLKGVIDELKKYEDERTIMKFIQYLDYYNRYSQSEILLPQKQQRMNNCSRFLEEFIAKNLFKKINQEINDPNFDISKTGLKNIKSYIDSKIMEIREITDWIFLPDKKIEEFSKSVLNYDIAIRDLREKFSKIKPTMAKKSTNPISKEEYLKLMETKKKLQELKEFSLKVPQEPIIDTKIGEFINQANDINKLNGISTPRR